MELVKTRCKSCGHVNSWHSFKWASTDERREHNRKNNDECPKCNGTDVSNYDDDETMAPYRFAVDVLLGKK